MKANNKGKSTVQPNDISWSNLTRGKEALTHIKVKIKIEDFTPRIIPCIQNQSCLLNKISHFNSKA